jgi:hypothetical protein
MTGAEITKRPQNSSPSVNLKTSKVLGLDTPSHLQQLANEVIE